MAVEMQAREPALPGQPVIDPACWTGEELAAREDWIFELSAPEISDLAAMAASVRGRIGDDPSGLVGLAREDFSLGAFAPRFERAKQILKDGVGLVLIRGLPVDDWDRLDLAIVYWGLGSQIGSPRSNNPQGDMIGHVTDKGKDLDNPVHRAYQTNAELYFHVDQCDMLSLLCIRQAKSGGHSKLVSSIALHNEMLIRRPDLAKVLAEPFTWSLHGEEGPGQAPWFESPVFNYVDGFLSVTAGYKSIEKGHKLHGTQPLSDIQLEALDYIEELGNDLTFETYLEPGDMPIINNQAVLHSRTGFEDWEDPERCRQLWRFWLGTPDYRPRSPYVENYLHGIWAPEEKRRVVLEAWQSGS